MALMSQYISSVFKPKITCEMKYFLATLIAILLWNCQNNAPSDISEDPEVIQLGENLFNRQCVSCHEFDQRAIGPALGGLTQTVDAQWIKSFIKDPNAVIASGDERAKQLLEEYKVVMPSFAHFTESELDAIVSFMHTKTKAPVSGNDSIPHLEDPIPQRISKSSIILDLETVVQIPASAEKSPLARINKIDYIDDRTFVIDLRGNMYELVDDQYRLFFSMPDHLPNFVDKPGLASGFGSFTFHPEFSQNGLWYTVHTEPAGSQQADFKYEDSIQVTLQGIVTEWKMSDPSATTFEGSHRELFRVNFVTGIHGMQEVTFNPRATKGSKDYGLLYVGLGDGGSTQKKRSQVCNHQGKNIYSSIIRIDPMGKNSANGQYGIPSDNPFVGRPGFCEEIWAYGFRNPHRLTWTPEGTMLASDIGQTHIEEVNRIEKGKFYGWPIREGRFVLNPFGNLDHLFSLPDDDHTYNVTYPLAAYDHDDGAAISGGFVVEKAGPLQGKYVFGDILNGRIFFLDPVDTEPQIQELSLRIDGSETTFRDLTEKSRIDLRLGVGPQDQLYVFTKVDGKIYKAKL